MRTNSCPVVLFAFKRPDHTRRTLDALGRNALAQQSPLIVYADGAGLDEDQARVAEVRTLVRATTGFRSVEVIARETNYGLARNITEGVTEACSHFGRVIVLEDDLVTSPWFLTFMNQALLRYADDERVACIHGYAPPVGAPLPETFFLRGADCWGWGTWSRAWQLFNPDGSLLLDELRRQHLNELFDFNGAFEYTRMLADQVRGANESWAIRWYASAFLHDKLTLYPGRSLLHNIGNDGSGRHRGTTDVWDIQPSVDPIRVGDIPVEDSAPARAAFETFFRSNQPRPRSLVGAVRRWLRSATS